MTFNRRKLSEKAVLLTDHQCKSGIYHNNAGAEVAEQGQSMP